MKFLWEQDIAKNSDELKKWLHFYALRSDVKFHEFFLPWNISWNISENFKKNSRFFRLYTHPFNIFYTSNITFQSFMHTAAPSADLQAYLLGLLV